MQWKIDLDASGGFMRAKQWGEFSLDEQARFLSDIFTSPDWRPGLGVLFDYRGLTVNDLESGDLTAISVIMQSVRRRLADSRIALLCDTDALFALGRDFGEMLAGKLHNRVVVFQDEDAAIAWLTAQPQS